MSKLTLHTPGLEELSFKEFLLADAETMSYNHGSGGTIPFPQKSWEGWYKFWINVDCSKRYYAYLKEKETSNFVGEISYRYDKKYDGHVTSVIILNKYRGKGYGREGLSLLIEQARSNGVKVLIDDIVIDNPVVPLFLSFGFVEDFRNDQIILLKKKL